MVRLSPAVTFVGEASVGAVNTTSKAVMSMLTLTFLFVGMELVFVMLIFPS